MMDPNQFGTMLGSGSLSAMPDFFSTATPATPAVPGVTPAQPAVPGGPMSILPPGGMGTMPAKPHPWSAEAILGKPPAPPKLPSWLGGPGGSGGNPMQALIASIKGRMTPTSQSDLGGLY